MGFTNKYKNGMCVVFTGKACKKGEKHDPFYYPPVGTHGVIADADGTTRPGIVWDNFIPRIVCNFNGRRGAYYSDCNWEICEPSDKILIMRDKKDPMRVIARDLGTNKTAEARCNPQDTFKFETGARLALDRLLGTEATEKKEPPAKFKVGDVVIANDKAEDAYAITVPGWIGYVVSVGSNGRIIVEEKKGSERYDVTERFFDLYRPVFKKGDRVRMRDPGHFNCHGWATDQVMTVKEYHPASDSYMMEENFYAFAPPWLVKVPGWNGRFTPVDTNDFSRWWTNGKIYEVKDGVLRDDDGEIRYYTDDKPVVDSADLQRRVPFKILEIKE